MKKTILGSILLAGLLFGGCASDEVESSLGGIYGTIRNATTGEPVYNAEIMLSPGNRTAVSGSDGSYEYRNLEPASYSLNVAASGYLYNNRTVTVVAGETTSCDMLLTPETPTSGITLSTSSLNFGTTYKELTFEIINTGTSGAVSWTISGVSAAWLSVSPLSGTTEMGQSSSVKVTIDRSTITENVSTIFMVNAAGGSRSIIVSASKAEGDNGGDNDGNGDNSGGGNSGGGGSSNDVTNGLYAYYMFEGNTNNAIDGAPNAQAINNPTYTDGVKGSKALKFSVADNSYISIPEAMIDGNAFSVSFWIKGLSDGHLFHVPLANAGRANGYVLTMKDGLLTFWSGYNWYYSMYGYYPFTHPTINASQWTMITLTSEQYLSYDPKAVYARLYIDGEYVDVVALTLDTPDCGTKFVFGGKFDTTTPPSMTIDNLRIYNSRPLSASEVKAIYNYEK